MAQSQKQVHGTKDGIKVRRHKGDIMSPEKRSTVMSRIRGKNTGPERILGDGLTRRGLKWESHAKDLPGRPDFVFREAKLVVFVDGDFWHGWRFPIWQDKLSLAWEDKIEANRARDRRNNQQLRRLGWKVVRIWEHQLSRGPDKCLEHVVDILNHRNAGHNIQHELTDP